MDSDNNLEASEMKDLDEMMAVGSSAKINLIGERFRLNLRKRGLARNGQYSIGFFVKDYAGNTSDKFIDVTIK